MISFVFCVRYYFCYFLKILIKKLIKIEIIIKFLKILRFSCWNVLFYWCGYDILILFNEIVWIIVYWDEDFMFDVKIMRVLLYIFDFWSWFVMFFIVLFNVDIMFEIEYFNLNVKLFSWCRKVLLVFVMCILSIEMVYFFLRFFFLIF